jgi:hypothetical protein
MTTGPSTPSSIPLLAAAVGLVGATVGAVLTDLISHRNLKAADLRRWRQEEEVQKRRWEREDRLRYHEDRLAAYKGLLEKTDPMRFRSNMLLAELLLKDRSEHESGTDDANEHGSGADDTADRLEGLLGSQSESEVLGYGAQIELLATTEEVRDTAKRLAEEAVKYSKATLSPVWDAILGKDAAQEALNAAQEELSATEEGLNKRRTEFLEAARRELGVPQLVEQELQSASRFSINRIP